MTDPHSDDETPSDHWGERVGEKELRKLRSRQEKNRSIWFGLGTFGLVGWSIVIPTLAGIFLGIWIDSTWPSRFSFTLMLFMGGLALGCYNAWRWVYYESGLTEDEKKQEENNDGN